MKPASMTEGASLTWCRIGLISVFAICVAAVALATPGGGVLSNVVSRATFGPFHVRSNDILDGGRFEVQLKSKGVSDIVT